MSFSCICFPKKIAKEDKGNVAKDIAVIAVSSLKHTPFPSLPRGHDSVFSLHFYGSFFSGAL